MKIALEGQKWNSFLSPEDLPRDFRFKTFKRDGAQNSQKFSVTNGCYDGEYLRSTEEEETGKLSGRAIFWRRENLGEREIYFVKWPPHSPANANGQFSHNAKVCQMSDRNGDKSIKNFREWSSSFCPLEAQDQFLQIFKQENATRRKFRNAPTVLPIILPIRLARYSREESFDRKHI